MQAVVRILFIAVVACDGAYMGVTTNVPQQLALGTPLSRRAAPAVAVISTKRPKVTKRVQEPKPIYLSEWQAATLNTCIMIPLTVLAFRWALCLDLNL